MKKFHLGFTDILVSLLLAFAMPAATSYLSAGALNFSVWLILQMVATFFALLASAALVRKFFTRLSTPEKRPSSKFGYLLDRLFTAKHSTLYLALIIFLCWLPALCMLYPGTLINDSWGQLNQVINLRSGAWTISAHHPVFDTALMSVIIFPAQKLFNNWHLAFFVYVLIQAICTSLVFAYSISYFKDKFHQKRSVSFAFLLIYCFFPTFVAAVQTVSKDALFSWIYLLFIIQLIEIIRTKGACLKNYRFQIALIAVCLLCVLTKKAGFYVLLGSLVLTLIFQKGHRKYLLIPIFATAAFNFLILPAVRYTFHIEESGTQEMLSVPFQQTARYVKEHESEVTADEKTAISKVLEYDNLAKKYNPINADPIKGYKERGEKSDYKNYLKVWLAQGIKHPETYLFAAAAHLSGWFSYTMYEPLTNMNWHNQLIDSYIPEAATKRNDFFTATSTAFDHAYKFIYSVPILGVILSFAFFATILPFFIFTTLMNRRKGNLYLLLAVPLFLSLLLGCYLAPVTGGHLESMRYLYPVVYTLPVMLMLSISLFGVPKVKTTQKSVGASARPRLK